MTLAATPAPNFTSGPSRPWLAASAIALITIVAYLPILRAGYIWDDNKHVSSNVLLHTADGLRTLWFDRTALPQYYPMTHTVFWVEYHLWGNDPLGYHVVNLLLHAANAIFVYLILRKLRVSGAFIAAIFFAVHPVNVETAGWISERKNTLSGFFYLCSFLAYLRFDEKSAHRAIWYVAALSLFVCSLLSKSVTCTLPAALLLVMWWRDRRLASTGFVAPRLRAVIVLLPFFIVGAALGLNTAYLERTHVASTGPEWRFASTIPGEVVARCLIASRAVWFYLSKLCFPYPLMFEYPRWHIDISVAWQFVFPVALLLLCITLFLLRRTIGRGPLAGMLFFIGTLFPALGFANLYPMRFSFVADHFQYLASIGPLTLIAAGISKLSTKRAGDFLPVELLVAALVSSTFIRTLSFQNEKELYSDSIRKNPNGWMSQTNYGAILAAEGELDAGSKHLLLGLHLHPVNGAAADKLGLIAKARNQNDAALNWFRQAVQLEPDLGLPHYDLGVMLDDRGDTAGALREYQLAIKLHPNHAPAHLNYGALLANQGDYTQAAKQFEEAMRIDPASTLVRRDLIAALERSGQLDEAASQIHELLITHPNDALLFNNLGLVESARHRRGAAMAAFSHALQLNPQLTEARTHLDGLLAPTTQPEIR